ncbi:MAG TPA: prolipoprotein diacylglyceryl transferase [Bryobacteraceae bacterium]
MYPKLISIGSFYIPTYGVLVALGFLAGLMIALRLARRSGLPADKIANLAVYCAIGGIAGAKLFMFFFDAPYYWAHPGEIFTLQTLQAAGVFHGGFIVALLVAIFYMIRQKLPVLPTMDAFAPGVIIGQAIGRLGCFAAGCCWGRECDLPWGVRFRSDFAAPVPLDKPLHPVQIYESVCDFAIFYILYRCFRRSHRPGQIIGLYLVLFSTVRFIFEFYRVHEQSLVGPFSLTQWIALALLLVGALMLWFTRGVAFDRRVLVQAQQ